MDISSKSRRWIHLTVGAVVSAVALIWSLTGVRWGDVWVALQSINLWPFIPVLIIFWVHCLIRAYRWRYLLPPPHSASISDLFDGLVIGNVCTYLLPLRAGEFIRPFIVSRRGIYPYPITLASVIIERFFDLSAVLICFGAVVSSFPEIPAWVFKGARALSVLAILLLLFILVGVFFKDQVVRFTRFITKFLGDRVSGAICGFADDLLKAGGSLRRGSTLMTVLIATVAVWGTNFIGFYLYLMMFPNISTTVVMPVAVSVIIALAVAAPSAPGFIGIYQVGCIGALRLYEVSNDQAVAFALVSHLVQYLTVLLFGLVCLRRQGIRWRELRERVEDNESPLDLLK